MKYTVLSEILLLLSLTLGKVSMCLLLLRILKQSSGMKKKIFLYCTIGLVTVTLAITLGQLLGQCHPVSKQWNPIIPGHCAEIAIFAKITYFNGGMMPRKNATRTS